MSFGILSVLSVGVVDSYFLGQLGGTPLAAIGFIFPVVTAFSSLAIGLSAGGNTMVSQSLGREDDPETTARYALHAVGFSVLLAALLAGLVFLFYPALFSLMGASPKVLDEIALYMPYWALSFPLLAMMMIVNAIFRAHGSGALSAGIMFLAAIVNIGLDPLLIFGWGPIPSLGTEGAAMASAAGRGVAVLAAVFFAIRYGYLDVTVACWVKVWDSLKQLVEVGAPAAFSNAINPAGMALVTAAVATLGDAAVAGFGAATRVQALAMVAMFALSSGIGPVVGQNWGAEKSERARLALWQAWIFCLGYGVAVGVVLSVFAPVIASAIASDASAAQYTREYLMFVGWSLFGYGFVVVTNAAMNARSKALHSMGLSLIRIFAMYLPLAWIGVLSLGFVGILAATIATNVIAAFLAVVAARAVGLLETDLGLVARPARFVTSFQRD